MAYTYKDTGTIHLAMHQEGPEVSPAGVVYLKFKLHPVEEPDCIKIDMQHITSLNSEELEFLADVQMISNRKEMRLIFTNLSPALSKRLKEAGLIDVFFVYQ